MPQDLEVPADRTPDNMIPHEEDHLRQRRPQTGRTTGRNGSRGCSRKTGGGTKVLLIIGGLVILGAISGAIRGFGKDRWQVANEGGQKIEANTTLFIFYDIRKEAKVKFRVTAKEMNGKPLRVFLVDQQTHAEIGKTKAYPQDKLPDLERCQIVWDKSEGTKEVFLSPSQCYIYFTSADGQDVEVDYKIEQQR